MSAVNPGDYMSPHRNVRMDVIRLANAEWVRSGGRGMRYCDSTECWNDVEDDFMVVDCVGPASWVTVTALIGRLPEDLQQLVLF